MRVDANLTKNHTLFAQYMQENLPVDNPALFPVSGLFYHMNTEFAMVQLTSTLTPSWSTNSIWASPVRTSSMGESARQDWSRRLG
jgi:hypothetical protein